MDNEYTSKAGVIKSVTLAECSSSEITPKGISGPLVAKIPVVIAEPIVQIDVESEIELEEPAFEIKRIKKNAFITQCKLIDTFNNSGKLFLSGFVRKNIEYATADHICDKNQSISGKIRHTTVNVPFTCVTKINFAVPPQLKGQEVEKELSLFSENIKSDDFNHQHILGRSPCEQNFQHFENFNEKVFCELEEVKIFEDDIHKDPKPLIHEFPVERTFEKIIEKMVILIRLKLLQKQQVNIPGHFHPNNGYK